MTLRQFEFKTESIETGILAYFDADQLAGARKIVADRLNELGKQGWDVVQLEFGSPRISEAGVLLRREIVAERPAPRRLQRKRSRGWKKPENGVSVCRPGRFGNPFATAEAFRNWIMYGEIATTQLLKPYRDVTLTWEARKASLRLHMMKILTGLPMLTGHDLYCWCDAKDDCHGDTLLKLANPKR